MGQSESEPTVEGDAGTVAQRASRGTNPQGRSREEGWFVCTSEKRRMAKARAIPEVRTRKTRGRNGGHGRCPR
jgi:hypothetical protein